MTAYITSLSKDEVFDLLIIENKKVLRCIDALEVASSEITNHESGSCKQFQNALIQIEDAIKFAKSNGK